MQNDHSSYTNSPKTNVISVCVCACEWLLPGESTMLRLNLCHCGRLHTKSEVGKWQKNEAQGRFFIL